jgi:hypothetical protein
MHLPTILRAPTRNLVLDKRTNWRMYIGVDLEISQIFHVQRLVEVIFIIAIIIESRSLSADATLTDLPSLLVEVINAFICTRVILGVRWTRSVTLVCSCGERHKYG